MIRGGRDEILGTTTATCVCVVEHCTTPCTHPPCQHVAESINPSSTIVSRTERTGSQQTKAVGILTRLQDHARQHKDLSIGLEGSVGGTGGLRTQHGRGFAGLRGREPGTVGADEGHATNGFEDEQRGRRYCGQPAPPPSGERRPAHMHAYMRARIVCARFRLIECGRTPNE